MLISVDSADHYDDITQKYAADSTAVVTAGVGRKGTAGIVTDGSTLFVEELKVLNETVESLTLINGRAFQLISLSYANAGALSFAFSSSDALANADTGSDTNTGAFAGLPSKSGDWKSAYVSMLNAGDRKSVAVQAVAGCRAKTVSPSRPACCSVGLNLREKIPRSASRFRSKPT
jgi:hypothetical protein